MKEIEDNTNRWQDTLCPWIGTNTVVKMCLYYPEQFIASKIIMAFFMKLEQ